MEADLLKDRIFDTANIAEKSAKPKFLGFLSPEQAVLADKLLSNRGIRYEFFGGFDNAQRVMLGCLPDWVQEVKFPITAITAIFRKSDSLSHRDFLGSLMALGLKRETVGDILVGEGKAVFFVTAETVGYITSQIEKIGRVGVNLEIGYELPLPSVGVLKEFSATVSSERLDCVVGVLANISRAKACEKIEQSAVSVNSVTIEKITAHVGEGDVISIRGSGRFIIDSLCDRTRKDRIILKYKKYV